MTWFIHQFLLFCPQGIGAAHWRSATDGTFLIPRDLATGSFIADAAELL